MTGWVKVREAAGVVPLFEGEIGGGTPMHVERFLRRIIHQRLPAYDSVVLLTILSGVRVEGGAIADADHSAVLPGETILIPPGCATEWHRPGTIDFLAFVFPEETEGVEEEIRRLALARNKPLTISDPLVTAAALHIIDELQKVQSKDETYIQKLSAILLEQIYRALAVPATTGFNPRHTQHERLKTVLEFIQKNLDGELSAQTLAARAGVSQTYFRELFRAAVGMPLHRYVLVARLELARRLLTTTNTPIARIAVMCGFSSQSHLTSSFRRAHAATPAEFRARG